MQSQTRLMRRGARYYFRAKVPADLLNHYDKREIVYSLKTSDPREAARLARVESVKLDNEFEQLRRGRPLRDARELRPEDIERLKAIWVAAAVRTIQFRGLLQQ